MRNASLNKIEKWCRYCFMIFYYSKVNDIKGPAVLASQIYIFLASNYVILREYLL